MIIMNGSSNEGNATLRELRKISKILILTNASVIEKELSKIANSDTRKKMWILTDGKRMSADIAKEAGVTAMAVSYFLNAGVVAELIEYERGEPPRRILDFVPPSWLDLIKLPTTEEEKTEVKKVKPEQAKLDEDKTSQGAPAKEGG